MFVKPAEGLKVRRPQAPHAFLPDEGAEVPDYDTYWHRRLNSGDVVLVEAGPEKTPAEKARAEADAAHEHATAVKALAAAASEAARQAADNASDAAVAAATAEAHARAMEAEHAPEHEDVHEEHDA